MGRLTDHPKIAWTRGEPSRKYATYTLAVNRRFKTEGQPDADFISCIAWNHGAEFAEKYMKKGVLFQIIGRLHNSSWTDHEGKKHWKTTVVVEETYFTGDKGTGSTTEAKSEAAPEGFYPIDESVEDDDLPF